MKIGGQQPSSQLKTNQTGQGEEVSQKDGALKGAKGSNGDPSVKTTLLSDKIKGRIAAEPEIRADRVAELKAQIQDGSFKVDSHELADKLLRDSLEEG